MRASIRPRSKDSKLSSLTIWTEVPRAWRAVALRRRVLRHGVVLGYEISTRIGVALGRAHYKYWHNTGTVGAFGAAAAAGSLLCLDEQAFANALALVGTFTAGLQQAFRLETMAKPMHAGRAAEAGL